MECKLVSRNVMVVQAHQGICGQNVPLIFCAYLKDRNVQVPCNSHVHTAVKDTAVTGRHVL